MIAGNCHLSGIIEVICQIQVTKINRLVIPVINFNPVAVVPELISDCFLIISHEFIDKQQRGIAR